MLEYFCTGLKYGAAVAGGLVALAAAGLAAISIGGIVAWVMERTNDDDEGGE